MRLFRGLAVVAVVAAIVVPLAYGLVRTPSPLAVATVGTPYPVKLTADGGGAQTWSVTSGALPAGLALSADGTLSGTPTAATDAPVSFTVFVSDGGRSDTKTLTLDVVAPLAALAPKVPVSEVGHLLRPTAVAATGGRAPYKWALVSGPLWLAFDRVSLFFTGTPDEPGSFPLQFTVKDVYGSSATLNVLIAVKARVAVTTKRLPVTKLGKDFAATLRASGGVTPYKWKVRSGKKLTFADDIVAPALPPGIQLDRTTGVLSGKTQKAGTYPLTVTVKDKLGETSEASLILTVTPSVK